MVDLFELLGVQVDAPKKPEEKKTAKKATKKKATEKKEEKFKLPLTLYTGYREPGQLMSGESELTLNEIREKIAEIYPEYAKEYSALSIKDGKCYIGFNNSKVLAKGIVKLSKDVPMMLAGQTFDLTSIMPDEEGTVDVSVVAELLANIHPGFRNAGIVHTESVMAPVFHLPHVGEDLTFPLRVCVYGRENFEISEAEFGAFMEKNGNDISDGIHFDSFALEEYVEEKFPDFRDHLQLQYDKETNIVMAVMDVTDMASVKSKGHVEKKEEKYPVEGTTISFIFNKVPLSPDMFDGKTELTKKEVIAYCESLYPEYAPERTDITWDKERKLLIPMLKGATKGAGMELLSETEGLARLKANPSYALFHMETGHGALLRIEHTPVSETAVCIRGEVEGWFKYHLPKLPISLLWAIERFFGFISQNYHTEALVRIYYNPETARYVCMVPPQDVTNVSVHTDMVEDCSLWPVMDIHSHGSLKAYFSYIDDMDEKGNRIFGVIGGYKEDGCATEKLFRAGTGGYFLSLSVDDVFEPDSCRKELTDQLYLTLMAQIDHVRKVG